MPLGEVYSDLEPIFWDEPRSRSYNSRLTCSAYPHHIFTPVGPICFILHPQKNYLQWSWTIFLDLRSRSYWNSLENPCLDHILLPLILFCSYFTYLVMKLSQWLKWYQIALKSSFEPYFLSLQPNLTQTLWYVFL